jgi:hypothetical protein
MGWIVLIFVQGEDAHQRHVYALVLERSAEHPGTFTTTAVPFSCVEPLPITTALQADEETALDNADATWRAQHSPGQIYQPQAKRDRHGAFSGRAYDHV